ncbi:uncharacterized protein LOC144450695 isoform X2 [Glandiceps talaboti]
MAGIGLSLLSRGVGSEIDKKGHKKLNVSLEPEDYHNIQSRKFYLPPIEQKVAWDDQEEEYDESPRELPLHKTFLTRKGAMLLFSEDMANKASRYKGHGYRGDKALEAEDFDGFEMKTIEDLRNAVLSYGMSSGESVSDTAQGEALYFNFLRRQRQLPEMRHVRPGFSAKRYMSNWSRSWDDSMLNTLRTKGHIWDKNLFQQNAIVPHLYRRINDDLSHMPAPYRINRRMLMSPGSLESYEFYKIRPDSADSGRQSEGTASAGRDSRASAPGGSIAAIARDEDDKAHAVTYADLEKEQQRQVLQRLLVQSAMHHQQQILEETMAKIPSKSPQSASQPSIKEVDMVQAIDDLVKANSTNLVVSGEDGVYSEKDVKTHYKSVVHREKHFGSSVIPTLPPIPSTRQMQRNQTSDGRGDGLQTGLPLITMEPPTPQQTFIRQTPQSSQNITESWTTSSEADPWHTNIDEEEILKQTDRSSKSTTLKKSSSKQSILSIGSGPIIAGGSHLQSSTESLGDSVSVHSAMKGNSLRSYRTNKKSSKRGTGSEVSGGTGSVVFGPDGEVISVGGAVGVEKESAASYDISAVIDANRDADEESDDSGHLSDGESYPASVATRKSRAMSQHSQKEIDLTAGDIDATMSFTRWSYRGANDANESEDEDKNTQHALNQSQHALSDEEGIDDDAIEGDGQSHVSIPVGDLSPRTESVKSVKSAKSAKSGKSEVSAKTAISTKSQLEVLEDHASAVAAAVLERPGTTTGRDLAKDAQAAAQLWSKMLGELFQTDDVQPNRTKSAEEWHRRNSIDSLWSLESSLPDIDTTWPGKSKATKPRKPHRITHKKSNSAEAAVSLLRQKLRHAGEAEKEQQVTPEPETETEEAEVEPEEDEPEPSPQEEPKTADVVSAEPSAEPTPVLADTDIDDALSNRSRSPSVKSARSTKSIQDALGGVKEGHIYHPAKKRFMKGAKGQQGPQQSIPSERGSHTDGLDLDITHYGTLPKDEARKSAKSVKDEDEQLRAAATEAAAAAAAAAAKEEAEKKAQEEEETRKKKELEEEEEKKKKELASRKSSKSTRSKGSAEKEKKKDFIVGLPKEKPQEFLQPKPPTPKKADKDSAKKKKKKESPTKAEKKKPEPKGKKKKKKGEKDEEDEKSEKDVKETEVKEKTPTPVEEKTEEVVEEVKEPTPPPSPPKEPSKEPTPEPEPELPEPTPDLEEEVEDEIDAEMGEDSGASGPGGPSRSQAKAAKRAAEADRRRREVERKRKEREEAKRRALEEAERAEQMKREFEEERRRREEEVRLRKEREEAERRKLEEDEVERERLQRIREERERREKEEYKRKMEELMRKVKEEEERKRLEDERLRAEEAERLRIEQEMLAEMEEAERLEYERRKAEEEAERLKREEEDRIRREHEAKLRQEEAERLARELAKKQKELEARLMFNRSLQSEAHGLDHTQDINPAFTWSYFELLQYLGIEIPEALKHKDF